MRAPEWAGPEATVAARRLIARTARHLEGSVDTSQLGDSAYGGSRISMRVPDATPSELALAVEALLHGLAEVEVTDGRHSARLNAGAGIVDANASAARATAEYLAHASAVERALRAYTVKMLRASPPSRPRRWFFGLTNRQKAWTLTLLNVLLAWLMPLSVYVSLRSVFHLDITGVLFWMVFGCVVVTAGTVYAEAVLALRRAEPPPLDPSPWPAASAVVVAYLPNEQDTIVDTVRCLLEQDYPGTLDVILAYNTPRPLQVEDELARLAAKDRRLVLLRVGDSTSKAQNVNAAMQVVTGEFVGVFDSDHRPLPGSFQRAARWIAAGADAVQGRNIVRNGESNWLTRMVAVEFEGIYSVAHPGRAALHGFGIFGGSNGYWRAEVLDRYRMRPDMLTEDIDISIRAVFDGRRIVVDPMLISEELAPMTPMALWSQRIRWSHGWHQVSRAQLRRIWKAQTLSVRQRMGASFLLGWREAYPWLSAQMIPILVFALLYKHGIHIQFGLPLFIAGTLYVSAVGPIQALFAWALAVPKLRRKADWWIQYMLVTGTLFGEFKAHVNRAAHIRELVGDRNWQVTPRGRARGARQVLDAGNPDTALTTVIGRGLRPDSVNIRVLERPLLGAAPARNGTAARNGGSRLNGKPPGNGAIGEVGTRHHDVRAPV